MTAETREIHPAPVVKTIRVGAPPERAFAVFAAASWWPATHSINRGKTFATAVLEPRVGGRWYERATDGSECTWGRVLAYDPPHRLVLGWQIDGTWTYDPDLLTEVEVTFAADGDGTLVTLVHRDLERFGAGAAEVRTMIDGDHGWPGLLAIYAAAA